MGFRVFSVLGGGGSFLVFRVPSFSLDMYGCKSYERPSCILHLHLHNYGHRAVGQSLSLDPTGSLNPQPSL